MDCDVCKDLNDAGYIICPKCGRNVFDFNYFRNLDKMEEKYGTRSLLELSKQKLSFSEIVTIRSFIERADRHCGDDLTSEGCRKDSTFANLSKRMGEVKMEIVREKCGDFTGDLKRIEERFHNFIRVDKYDEEDVKITEELFVTGNKLYIPFGWMNYFLAVDDGKPVLYIRMISRMDMNSMCFIDAEGVKCYDLFLNDDHKDIRRKFREKRRNVRMPRQMRGIPKSDR